ncbi:MAG: fibronectin type III domain-containing protein [Bdellovibrionales bacterium]|nr:fibronectin type III domain-containing protein [Bdellovibrionales bacterium]
MLARATVAQDYALALVSAAGLALAGVSCGQKIPFDSGGATARDAVGSSSSIGAITQVTFVASAQDLGATWPTTDLLFNGTDYLIGDPTVDNGEVAIRFVYDYPANNFKLTKSQLVVDVSRNSTDTEGVMVCGTNDTNGVFTGRPPAGQFSNTTTRVAHAYYEGSPAADPDENLFFNQWQVDHYKHCSRNTSDFNLQNLLSRGASGTGSAIVTPLDMLGDGDLTVVFGDDTPVYQGYLILTGYTIAQSALSCANSASRTFQNEYVHEDGTSFGSSFFTGTVRNPHTSCGWSNPNGYGGGGCPAPLAGTCGTAFSAPFQAVEFHFDAPLPNVGVNNVAITQALLTLNLERQASGKAAIVVNGVGIGETGFISDPDTSAPTAQVTSWLTDGTTVGKWETTLAGVTPGTVTSNVVIDLFDLYGANQIKTLLAEGKLNVALAGSIAKVQAEEDATNRAVSNAVWGPTLSLQGTYFNNICAVPDDPDSPLSGALPDYPPVGAETAGPVIGSLQVIEVTDTTAKVLWITDEWADSTVEYSTGIDYDTNELIAPTTITLPAGAQEENDIVHEVALTGLSKYTIYFFQVKSRDYWGNETVSPIPLFRTKR